MDSKEPVINIQTMHEQINLDALSFSLIQKDPNQPPLSREELKALANKTYSTGYPPEFRDQDKKACQIISKLKNKYFKHDYNLHAALSTAINLVIQEKDIEKNMPRSSSSRKTLSQMKKLIKHSLTLSRLLQELSVEDRDKINSAINSHIPLHNVENIFISLEENGELYALEHGCEQAILSLPEDKTGRQKSNALPAIMPHLIKTWDEGANQKAQCYSLGDGDTDKGYYSGNFYIFVTQFNSVLQVFNPKLTLGSNNSIGQFTKNYLQPEIAS